MFNSEKIRKLICKGQGQKSKIEDFVYNQVTIWLLYSITTVPSCLWLSLTEGRWALVSFFFFCFSLLDITQLSIFIIVLQTSYPAVFAPALQRRFKATTRADRCVNLRLLFIQYDSLTVGPDEPLNASQQSNTRQRLSKNIKGSRDCRSNSVRRNIDRLRQQSLDQLIFVDSNSCPICVCYYCICTFTQ